ncbi:MAG: TetR/AcrR family transcriptional regulator [Firmicutes bacterium]|uniref:TetR/AcrR family transcriptional regulator n=1 Tax=Candidatus Stercoripulliclostridium pullicola TaxID=2840953 RepID=A0A940ICJ7_9FIRM|nr:TetR/AcrR family transcriptional regulator [Candidatus Stercoripulliclostridium pullicola]
MGKEIREPRQERSIEKKNRIIRAGYELFSEVGYYNTNTAEIAKRAGVSTGIVYGYFRDKKDILTAVLTLYMDKICEPIFGMFDDISASGIREVIPKILDSVIIAHRDNAKIHEALHSMTHTDEEVNAAFIRLEDEITSRLESALTEAGIGLDAPRERIHFAMDVIQSFAHEYVYDHHEYIDYAKMRGIVTETLYALFAQ